MLARVSFCKLLFRSRQLKYTLIDLAGLGYLGVKTSQTKCGVSLMLQNQDEFHELPSKVDLWK